MALIRFPKKRRKRYHSGAPGATPGTLDRAPESQPTRIHLFTVAENGTLRREAEPGEDRVRTLLEEGTRFWLDVSGFASLERIRQLGEVIGLHGLLLEDVLNVPQPPKAEVDKNCFFVLTRSCQWDDGLNEEQVGLVLNRTNLVTFREGKQEHLDKFVREMQNRSRDLDLGYLAYRLLDFCVDRYFPVLNELEDRLYHLEHKVVLEKNGGSISEIFQYKSLALDLRGQLLPHRNLIQTVLHSTPDWRNDSAEVHYRDVADHIDALLNQMDYCRETATNLMALHQSVSSTRTNEVMRLLTVMAAIFVPLTFITGLYGMNFDPQVSPWNLPELSWYYGYPFALSMMAGVAAFMYFYFRRRGWI